MTTLHFPTGLCCLVQNLQLATRLMRRHGRYQHAHLPDHTNETCTPHCASPRPVPPQRLSKKKKEGTGLFSACQGVSCQLRFQLGTSCYHHLQTSGWETLVQVPIIIPAISKSGGKKKEKPPPPSASPNLQGYTHFPRRINYSLTGG